MGRIRAKDTKPEMTVRRMLHGIGYRYRLHQKRLPGCPDLVFPSKTKVIFVNGCFWHGHTCGRGFKPKSNAEFWCTKIEANRTRDTAAVLALEATGWQCLTVWECDIRPAELEALQGRLVAFLEG